MQPRTGLCDASPMNDDFPILAAVAANPTHPYALLEHLQALGLHVSRSTLYRRVEALAAQGWLDADDIRGESGHSWITPSGRHALTLFDPFHFEQEDTGADGRLTAMMPGRVVKVMANVGDSVKKGQALIIMEAMKMEHTITAPAAGTVKAFCYAAGEQVGDGAELVEFEGDS